MNTIKNILLAIILSQTINSSFAGLNQSFDDTFPDDAFRDCVMAYVNETDPNALITQATLDGNYLSASNLQSE